jgi:hypothetical protein
LYPEPRRSVVLAVVLLVSRAALDTRKTTARTTDLLGSGYKQINSKNY